MNESAKVCDPEQVSNNYMAKKEGSTGSSLPRRCHIGIDTKRTSWPRKRLN